MLPRIYFSYKMMVLSWSFFIFVFTFFFEIIYQIFKKHIALFNKDFPFRVSIFVIWVDNMKKKK